MAWRRAALRFLVFLSFLLLTISSCATRQSDRYLVASESRERSPFERAFQWDSQEWKRLIVRDPSLPISEKFKDYPENLHRSVLAVFEPWYENQSTSARSPYSQLNFLEMLRAQHVYLTNGKFGRYEGATLIMHDLGSQIIPSGRYRFEIYDNEPDKRILMSFQIDGKLTQGLPKQIEKLREFYLQQEGHKKDEEPSLDGKQLTNFQGRNAAVQVLALPRISDERIKVWNEVYGGWITHFYVRLGDTPVILGAMGSALQELKKLPPRPDFLRKNFIRLEEFLYLGIHAHPFESGNFSLIMSQVNYILWRHGLRGISHGTLDFYGLIERFEDFQARFRRMVLAENPTLTLPELPESKSKSPDLNILAHVSWAGDLYFSDKAVVEDPKDREHGIEGLKIMPLDVDGDLRLEYMAHIPSAGDSRWHEAGEFMGSRGNCESIDALALRLVGSQASRYRIFYQARLGIVEWTPIHESGQVCGTRSSDLPITGIRIWLELKK